MHSGQLCDRKKFSFRITEIVVGNHMHFHWERRVAHFLIHMGILNTGYLEPQTDAKQHGIARKPAWHYNRD